MLSGVRSHFINDFQSSYHKSPWEVIYEDHIAPKLKFGVRSRRYGGAPDMLSGVRSHFINDF
jgi:hypothetical protein